MPALCTSTSGAPTASSIALAAAAIDAASSRSSRTPSKRGSSAAAPVAARRRSSPASGERIARDDAPSAPYRWAADARPSPRDAPVMTTLRGSGTVGLAVLVLTGRHVGRPSGWPVIQVFQWPSK